MWEPNFPMRMDRQTRRTRLKIHSSLYFNASKRVPVHVSNIDCTCTGCWKWLCWVSSLFIIKIPILYSKHHRKHSQFTGYLTHCHWTHGGSASENCLPLWSVFCLSSLTISISHWMKWACTLIIPITELTIVTNLETCANKPV